MLQFWMVSGVQAELPLAFEVVVVSHGKVVVVMHGKLTWGGSTAHLVSHLVSVLLGKIALTWMHGNAFTILWNQPAGESWHYCDTLRRVPCTFENLNKSARKSVTTLRSPRIQIDIFLVTSASLVATSWTINFKILPCGMPVTYKENVEPRYVSVIFWGSALIKALCPHYRHCCCWKCFWRFYFI